MFVSIPPSIPRLPSSNSLKSPKFPLKKVLIKGESDFTHTQNESFCRDDWHPTGSESGPKSVKDLADPLFGVRKNLLYGIIDENFQKCKYTL